MARQPPRQRVELIRPLDDEPSTAPRPGVHRRRWTAPLLLGGVIIVAALAVSLGDGDEPTTRPVNPSPTTAVAPSPATPATPATAATIAAGGGLLDDRLLAAAPAGFGAPRATELGASSPDTTIDAAVLWSSGPDPRGAWLLATLATDPAGLTRIEGGTVRTTAAGRSATVGRGGSSTMVATGDVPGGHAAVVAAGLTEAEVLSALDGLALDPTAPDGYRIAGGSLPTRIHLVGSSGGAAANSWDPVGQVVYPALGSASNGIAVLTGPTPAPFQTVLEQFFLVDAVPVTVDGQPGFAGTDWSTGTARVVFDRGRTHVTISSLSEQVSLTAFAQTLQPATIGQWQTALTTPP